PARGARLQVFRAGDRLLAEGITDKNGIYVFSFTDPEALRVVIAAGLGHRKEISISADVLGRAVSQTEYPIPSSSGRAETTAVAVPLTDHGSEALIKDVLIGVSFLLALAAFALSLRNARKLRDLASRP